MRILFHIIFLCLVALVAGEDFVTKIYTTVVSSYKKFHKRIKQRYASSVKLTPWTFRVKKKHPMHRKRQHVSSAFSFPIKYKMRYFAFGILFSFFFLFLPLLLAAFLQDIPSPKELTYTQIPQTTKVYDRNGVLLAEFYSTQNRTLIHLSNVPKILQEATLATEDKNFYNHPGFDIPSIIRAFKVNVLGGHLQGGSTITQQLIKSSMLTPEQDLQRKVKEIILAFWAERIYRKNQILEMYFNQVPYGGTAWGIEAAAETYFNEPVKDLDLAQSALLAGLTSAPSIYSPYSGNGDAWKKRQKEVLKRMVAVGYITQKQADKAAKESLHFQNQQAAIHAPHFVNYIKTVLADKYGLPMVEKGGLQVYTTLDVKTQKMAEKVVKDEVNKDAYLNLTNGAALITDPKNGDILAMVGSKDFNDPDGGNVNIVTSLRQPGSSIKVVTYSAALSHGFTAASILDDNPITYQSSGGDAYSPVNYDGKFHGRVPLRIALANSLNIPAVKTLNTIGVPTMVDLAKKMGVRSWGDPSQYGLSLTLGAAEVTMLDMARVNGTLANQGKFVDLNPILKVSDGKGNVLEEKHPSQGKRVLDQGVAFILSNILADNKARTMEFGPNSPLLIPYHYVSVKTGTTDNKRDNWTNGYTNNYVVIIWTGNNDNSPMSQNLASGITGAAPIWHSIMENLLTKHPETKPSIPSEIVQKTCFGRQEYFINGTENTADCSSFVKPPTGEYTQNRQN